VLTFVNFGCKQLTHSLFIFRCIVKIGSILWRGLEPARYRDGAGRVLWRGAPPHPALPPVT